MPASLRSDGVRDYPGMPFGFPSERAFSFAGIPNRPAYYPFPHSISHVWLRTNGNVLEKRGHQRETPERNEDNHEQNSGDRPAVVVHHAGTCASSALPEQS